MGASEVIIGQIEGLLSDDKRNAIMGRSIAHPDDFSPSNYLITETEIPQLLTQLGLDSDAAYRLLMSLGYIIYTRARIEFQALIPDLILTSEGFKISEEKNPAKIELRKLIQTVENRQVMVIIAKAKYAADSSQKNREALDRAEQLLKAAFARYAEVSGKSPPGYA